MGRGWRCTEERPARGQPPAAPRPYLEPDVNRERGGQSAEIDLAAGEILIRRETAFRGLIPQLSADAPRSDRHADPAKNHRTGRGAASLEGAGEDRIIGRQKLTTLPVVVVEEADARADVRF